MEAAIPDKPTFTLEEVSDLTGFSLRSLQEACRANPPRVPHHRFGRQRVMSRAHVLELLAATEVRPPATPDPAPAAVPVDSQAQRIAAAKRRAAVRVARAGVRV